MIRDNYIDITKLITNPNILHLFKIVSDNGGVLRLVGGAVRDALKGIPSSDLNLVTDLSPEELVEACTEASIKTVPLGIRQDAVGVIVDNTQVEISSLGRYVDRNGVSELEFTDNWEADASQRDLTINAVYADEKGNVFDYYNGIEDLEKGYVRFIGSAKERIKQDSLRILRYFRFYSLFGLAEPNKKAYDACVEGCSLLKKIPMERIRDELFKIIVTPNAPRAYRLMQQGGILSYIMPDAEHIQDLEFFNFAATGQTIDNEAIVKLFILYRPNPSLAENMSVRLKMNRREKQLFTNLAKENIQSEDLLNPQNLNKIVYLYGADFIKAKLLTDFALVRTAPDHFWEIYSRVSTMPALSFPLKGKDVLAAGFDNPHKVGAVLKDMEQLWIDSNFSLSKEHLLSLLEVSKEVI